MGKILSVCIPTYNMEALLSRCLDSFIIEKEYMDKLEIIIVNDGSKDNSSKIAHEYADKYPNTYIVIDKPNGNYGSCINAALKVATGKYFRICDSDDRYDRENLMMYVSNLLNTDADLTITPYVARSFNNEVRNIQSMKGVETGISFNVSDVVWSEYKFMQFRAMHSIAVRTSLLVENNYVQLEGISYTDTQFVFYAVLYSNTCVFYDLPIYQYYLGRDGQTMSMASMIKSNMHFYKNGKVLLDEFIQLPRTVSENKRALLFDGLFVEFYCFMNLILLEMKGTKQQQILLKDAIQ